MKRSSVTVLVIRTLQSVVVPAIMSGDKPNLSGESTACQLSPKIQIFTFCQFDSNFHYTLLCETIFVL